MIFGPYSAFALIPAAIFTSFSVVVYFGYVNNKRLSTKAFLQMLVVTIVWMISMGLSSNNGTALDYLGRFQDFISGCIAALFLYFCLTFPEDKKVSRWIIWGLILVELMFIPLYLSGLMEYGSFFTGGIEGWSEYKGPLWFLHDIFFDGFFLAGLSILYLKYKHATVANEKVNLKLMFWGMTISIIPAALVSVILPEFGYTQLDWLSPILVMADVAVVSYSIVKYRQMSIKAVTAEVLVLILAIVLFVNIFISGATFGVYGKTAIFFVFASIGYLFIKNILKEAVQKEQLEDFNKNLNQKVADQTIEIRSAYEAEKKARIELEKANKELLELDKRKTEFLSVVAHQLRTPLSGIKWALNMILHNPQDPVSEGQAKLITTCNEGNERMITLVNTLLNADRVSAKDFQLTLGSVDLVALMAAVIGETQLSTKERSITITFEHDEHIPPVTADPEMLRIAFQNLLDNAVKYSPQSGIVSVRAALKGAQVECSVTDNGIGIPADQQQYIFSRFFRAKNAISADPNGNGLGLFVTKSILEKLGGKVWFTTEEHKGTTFYFTLAV